MTCTDFGKAILETNCEGTEEGTKSIRRARKVVCWGTTPVAKCKIAALGTEE